jgi:hypothetical protein
LEKAKYYLDNIDDITESTISYLGNKRMFDRPFNNYDDLLKIIKDEFGDLIKIPISVISGKKQELESITFNLSIINSISTIDIAGKKYSSIDNSVNWDFIKQNYEQIKIINKNLVSGLFASDELKPIKNLFDLNRHQFSKDYYFLFDFSSKIYEFTEMNKTNQEIIRDQEKIIDSAKENIKIQLKNNFMNECRELESKLINYLNKQKKNDSELKKKEAELINLKLVKII